jgi:hypothetical protein
MSASIRPLVAAGATAVTATIAVPALTTAQSTTAREIVVREKVQSLTFVQHSSRTKGDRRVMGDRVLIRQALFDADSKRIGTLYTDCVNVGGPARVFAATLQCTASYRFADGQFSTVGAIRLGGALGSSATPIAGSGAYRGQRGEVASTKPVKGYDSVDVLRIDAS